MINQLFASKKQQGYFLILAVILILVIGMLGVVMTSLFASRANISAAQLNGLRSFYMAESGLEIGARLLTNPVFASRITCGSLTGTASVTNASIASGTFTLTTINSSPVLALDVLATAITSTSTSLTLSDVSGFAPNGRVLIDREAIDYAALSGATLLGLKRGANGTIASAHIAATPVSQYQCSIDAKAGIPSIASATYQRDLQWSVQLQDGWLAGNPSGSNYVLSRWNRSTEEAWNAQNLAGGSTVGDLYGLNMLSNGDGWIVGERTFTTFTIGRWNGAAWSLSTSPTSCTGQHLYGVSMASVRNGFAVGARYRPACASSGNFRYTVLYWNGTSWALLTPTTTPSIPADTSARQDLNAVSVVDTAGTGLANIGFAVGNSGNILRYNGSNWAVMTSPTTQNLNGVYTVSTSEAWAVGNAGVILRYNGTSFSTFTSPVTTNLTAIAMYDTDGDGLANIGWAVGDSGRILTYNGSSWSFVDLGGTNLTGVDYFNDKDVWAVGAAGVAYHWDGSAWTIVSTGQSVTLNAISLVHTNQRPTSSWQQVFR